MVILILNGHFFKRFVPSFKQKVLPRHNARIWFFARSYPAPWSKFCPTLALWTVFYFGYLFSIWRWLQICILRKHVFVVSFGFFKVPKSILQHRPNRWWQIWVLEWLSKRFNMLLVLQSLLIVVADLGSSWAWRLGTNWWFQHSWSQ